MAPESPPSKPHLLKSYARLSRQRKAPGSGSISAPESNISPPGNEAVAEQHGGTLPSPSQQRLASGSSSDALVDQQAPIISSGRTDVSHRSESPGFRYLFRKFFKRKKPAGTVAQSAMVDDAKRAWHGFKMVSGDVETFLDGTPFKIPVSVLDTLIRVTDAMMNNKESLAMLLLSIGQRLQNIGRNIKQQEYFDDIGPTCRRFRDALVHAVTMLQEMEAQMSMRRVLKMEEDSQRVAEILKDINEAAKNFELELKLANHRRTEKIKENSEIIRLSRLKPVWKATYHKVNHERCVEGTRKDIIDCIMVWCKDTSPESPVIYWLSGMAGTGKSTIAYTICQQLFGENQDTAHRLGASFFCSHQVVAARARKNIIPTIVHDLAHSFPAFGRAVLDARLDIKALPMEEHIPSLLFALWSVAISTDDVQLPLVVVVDALDELEDGQGSVFLAQLIKEITKHSERCRGLKFFVTSRRDPEIDRVCESISSESVCRLEDVPTAIIEHDINLYLRTKLPALDEPQLNTLTSQTSGLFIYAATAVRFIIPSLQHPPTAVVQKQRLDVLTKAWPRGPQNTMDDLVVDHLYEEILMSWLSPMSEDDQIAAISILQTVVCTEVPVLVSDLSHLLGKDELSSEVVLDYIQPLHSVLYISDGHAYLYHKSFSDFILDKTRFTNTALASQISLTVEHQFQLASFCFRLMEFLHFNICRLPSSYIEDSEVPGLADCVHLNISSSLKYACCHWVAHISKVKTDNHTMKEYLKMVFWKWLEERSLFWIEVMNLLGMIEECYPMLVTARQWLGMNVHLAEKKDLLALENLVSTFAGNIIVKSTPHLYISALAASSPSTKIMGKWLDRFPGIPKITDTTHLQTDALLVLQHTASVTSANFSSDGTRIVAGSHAKDILIWDASTGEQLYQLDGHDGWVQSVSFLPDGMHVLSGSNDKTMRVWDVLTGKQLHRLGGHRGYVQSVCVSLDGTRIVSASHDRTVRVWTASGEQLYMLDGHKGYVRSACFSPNGSRLASGSDDRTLRIWDMTTGSQLSCLAGHTGCVLAVSFSPDGTSIVSGSDDKTLRIWDTDNGAQLHLLEGHDDWVQSVCFSPDGTHVLSGSRDKTVRVWNLENGIQSHRLDGHDDWVQSVSFSMDGRFILTGSHDRTVRVWDSNYDPSTWKPLLNEPNGGVHSICFSPDGKHIVSGSGDKIVHVWDSSTRSELHKLEGHEDLVYSVCFSPDGMQIVSGSRDNTMRIWDLSAGSELQRLEGHENWVYSACFSPDGTHILSGSGDQTVRVWDASTGRELRKLVGHEDSVHSVCFSPDGHYIVSGSRDMTVRIWVVSTGRELRKLEGHQNWVYSVCFSPDGSRIVSGSGDKTVRLWDPSTGSELQELESPRSPVYSVCFSPDGAHIISGLGDNSINIWELSSGRQLQKLEGHDKPVQSVCFSPDGKHIASGSEDETVRIWDHGLTRIKLLFERSTWSTAHSDYWMFRDEVGSISDSRTDWSIHSDGWITSSDGSPYLWLSRDMHKFLQRPDCLMISTSGAVDVDFTTGRFGTAWQECYRA